MTVDPAGSGAPMSERMQSLLSRAAEDQLAEQRQLAGALNDLRAQLQSIAQDVAVLRERPGGSGGSVEGALASVTADVREAVRLLGERLDGVARLVTQRGTDLAELNAASSALQAAVRGHGEALAGLGSGLSALPSFGDRIGGLQNNLAALHERLTGLDELTATVGALQQRVDSVDHGLRELRSAFAAIGARMAELPGRADLDAAAGRSTAAIEGLGERLGRLEDGLRGIGDGLATAQERATPEPTVDLGPLHERLSRLDSAHADAAAGANQRLSALEGQLADVLAALVPADDDAEDDSADEADVEDPVATELAELREALLGEGGIAERLDAAGDEDLDEKVSAAVERAVAASEERLSAHFDEAVLALAEALLRRRPGRASARPAATPMAAAPLPAPVAAPPGGPAPQDDDEEPDEAVIDEPASEEQSVDTPWQTPPEAGEGAHANASSQFAEGERRRRPWWRPGD